VTVASLQREIERYQDNYPDYDIDRYAIIPPTEAWNAQPQPHEIPEQRVLRELSQRLGVPTYLSPTSNDIVDAVYQADQNVLFPAPLLEVGATPQIMMSGPASSPVLSIPLPTSRTVVSATNPQSTAAEPESVELSPVATRMRNVHRAAEASQLQPSQPSQAPVAVPIAVPVKKKLVRRAKTSQTQGTELGPHDVFGSSAPGPSQTQAGFEAIATQQSRLGSSLGASLGPTTSATQVVDSVLTQTVAPSTARKLKRRVGTIQDEPLSFLEQAAKDSPILKKARKTPEPETIAEVAESEEEDPYDRVDKKKHEKPQLNKEANKRRIGATGPSDSEAATPRPGTKRAWVPVEDSPPPTPAAPRHKIPPTQAARHELKKKLIQARDKVAENLLLVKPVKRRGENAEEMAQIDLEFNQLKLVKPTLKYARPAARDKIKWNDVDEEEDERRRFVQEDEEMMEHPDLWRQPSQSMFVVKTLATQNRRSTTSRDDLAVDPKWAGRPNFKKFRVSRLRRDPIPSQVVLTDPTDCFQPKKQQAEGVPRQSTVTVTLAAPEPLQALDYGLGPGECSLRDHGRDIDPTVSDATMPALQPTQRTRSQAGWRRPMDLGAT